MDYYCFIPKEKRLLIPKNRAFDFIECEYVFINIYMLLWRCVVHTTEMTKSLPSDAYKTDNTMNYDTG